MSELTDGWGLLVVGVLAWVAVAVPASLALGRLFRIRTEKETR